MKKKVLLLLTSLTLLVGCATSSEYTPSHGGLVEPEAPAKENGPSDEGFNDDAVSIYEFYFSYSHSDEPLATVEGPTFKALGKDKVPEFLLSQNTLVATGAEKGYQVDPAFPTFIGWSMYGVCLNEEKLWDFSVYYEKEQQRAVISLYAIWVNK